MSFDSNNIISWSRFEECNSNTTTAFEGMCRVLFKKHFLHEHDVIHSNPNNPGVEILPVKQKETGKRISFQAKYFTTMDYDQIKQSAEMTIKHYSNQIDVVYLYCNKDVTTTSKSYTAIKELLGRNNIEIIPITNNTILDQVLSNQVISALYFQKHCLSMNWFRDRFQDTVAQLGNRYNHSFNVETSVDDDLNLFSHNKAAIDYINSRKQIAIDALRELSKQNRKISDICDLICYEICRLNDIVQENIEECLLWKSIIDKRLENALYEIREKVSELETMLFNNETRLSEHEIVDLQQELRALIKISNILNNLEFNSYYKNLIINKTLCISGDAGNGKTHLIATFVNSALDNGHAAIMSLGGCFLSAEPIEKQLMNNLGLDYSIDDFLNVLEGMGESTNKLTILFIDAINESNNINIWESGLLRLIVKVERLNYVRLAFSIRSGYEGLIFKNGIQAKLDNNTISSITHTGFRNNSFEAIKKFLNYYNIPFSPTIYLQSEMTKPLFLMLFCKNNLDAKFDIFTLFDKVVENASFEALSAANKNTTQNLLIHLLDELAEPMIYNSRIITSNDLYNATFWNKYGLADKKIEFIVALEKNGILIRTPYGDEEIYHLGYNLLEDYICAKSIIKKFATKDAIRSYIIEDLLDIQDDQIRKTHNIEIYIALCIVYSEKFKEECIDIIEPIKNTDYIIDEYVKSFSWRAPDTINTDDFNCYITQNKISRDVLWEVLIDNSVKLNHPLNAVFLHNFLLSKSVSNRDYIWTTYINSFNINNSRVAQLIDYYFKGGSLDLESDSIRLLLILFAWILTSSNRVLRDKASKAMIEILKDNFNLCQYILELFNGVNDPYVIQRLYGVVFGACVKRTTKSSKDYIQLTRYVYETIFCKETVYPDILLRDYAQLVIERCCFEYPEICSTIDISKITPPYKSEPIPKVVPEEYYNEINYNGYGTIARSMRTNSHFNASYGDFGRYVFETALRDFEAVDIENLYHFAMQYIRDELGYKNEDFAEYDDTIRFINAYEQNEKKTERIGKKYQWIAMYNILARISDSNQVKYWDNSLKNYCGAWNPYVRDFDPTLNTNFLIPDKLPEFLVDKIDYTDDFIVSADSDGIEEWGKEIPIFFTSYNNKLLISDSSGDVWVKLFQHSEINNTPDNNGKYTNGDQRIWTMSNGYFVKEKDFQTFKDYLTNKNFMGRRFPEAPECYCLYNREMPWSSGYNDVIGSGWIEHEKDSSEEIEIIHKAPILNSCFTSYSPHYKKEVLGSILPAYVDFIWEQPCDSSQDRSISFYIPCKELISCLSLEQKVYDGYFYDENGTLVVFDGNLADIEDGLFIRKEHLDKFLYENGLKLFWICFGEKQFFTTDFVPASSEWGGFLYLDGDRIGGDFENKEGQPYIE